MCKKDANCTIACAKRTQIAQLHTRNNVFDRDTAQKKERTFVKSVGDRLHAAHDGHLVVEVKQLVARRLCRGAGARLEAVKRKRFLRREIIMSDPSKRMTLHIPART